MPFKVHYEIFDDKHGAADYQTYDYTMARVEWFDRQRNPRGLMWRLEQTVMPDGDLTKPEEFLKLVYDIRIAMKKYFNGGRRHEDMMASLKLESQLDKWIRRTRDFIDHHLMVKDAATSKRYSFFIIVEAWRQIWHERKKLASGKDYDSGVYREMTRKIRQLEKEIDEYIKQIIKLI